MNDQEDFVFKSNIRLLPVRAFLEPEACDFTWQMNKFNKESLKSTEKLEIILQCLPCVTYAMISGGIKVRIMTKNWKRVALLQI